MAASHSVMEPGPSTGSMVVGDNDDNNNDDILTRAEAIELEEIARSPEHNKESREIAATLSPMRSNTADFRVRLRFHQEQAHPLQPRQRAFPRSARSLKHS